MHINNIFSFISDLTDKLNSGEIILNIVNISLRYEQLQKKFEKIKI